jgi:hypothetical protein
MTYPARRPGPGLAPLSLLLHGARAAKPAPARRDALRPALAHSSSGLPIDVTGGCAPRSITASEPARAQMGILTRDDESASVRPWRSARATLPNMIAFPGAREAVHLQQTIRKNGERCPRRAMIGAAHKSGQRPRRPTHSASPSALL